MSKEYIEKETALNSVCYDCCERDFCGSPCVDYERISGLPPAEVKPVVRGEWISVPHKRARICSHCECDEPYKFAENDADVYNFCPNCGADMRKEEQDGK